MAANQGTTYTYSSVIDGNSALDGTFTWTTPNPPTPGTLGGTYTLSSNTSSSLTMGSISVNGQRVSFTITTGGVTYTFSGNFNNGNNQFNGDVNPPADPDAAGDDWTASAQ
jgi:hypothetical protein